MLYTLYVIFKLDVYTYKVDNDIHKYIIILSK